VVTRIFILYDVRLNDFPDVCGCDDSTKDITGKCLGVVSMCLEMSEQGYKNVHHLHVSIFELFSWTQWINANILQCTSIATPLGVFYINAPPGEYSTNTQPRVYSISAPIGDYSMFNVSQYMSVCIYDCCGCECFFLHNEFLPLHMSFSCVITVPP